MSRVTKLRETPCWYVEWSFGGPYPFTRIFYSDLGKTFEDAKAWVEEKKADSKIKYIKLIAGIHKHGMALPILDKNVPWTISTY